MHYITKVVFTIPEYCEELSSKQKKNKRKVENSRVTNDGVSF